MEVGESGVQGQPRLEILPPKTEANESSLETEHNGDTQAAGLGGPEVHVAGQPGRHNKIPSPKEK